MLREALDLAIKLLSDKPKANSIEIVNKETKGLIASIGENDIIIHEDYEVIESDNDE